MQVEVTQAVENAGRDLATQFMAIVSRVWRQSEIIEAAINAVAAAEARGYERGIREAAALALQYRDDAGGAASYKQACRHIENAILAKLEKTDD